MISPPALVSVRDLDGALRPALLLARRDDRSYVQVSRGAGDSVLRWLPSSRLAPASPCTAGPGALPVPTSAAPGVRDTTLARRSPRSAR